MEKTTKRTLASVLIGVYLLAACAPAPAARQEPAPVQQEVEPTSTVTVVPTNTQAPAEEAVALSPIPPTESTFEPLDGEIPAPPDSESADTDPADSDLPVTDESAGTPISVEELEKFLFSINDEFINCTYTITPRIGEPEERTVQRNPPLEIGMDSEIIIVQPVNLRTGPTLDNRILLTIRPDPGKTVYKIMGGPAYTDLSADEAIAETDLEEGGLVDEIPPYSVAGRKYKWWQIESPDKSRTGWIVEASACGLYYFIEPVTR
jgi:hypothetical protein